MHTISATQLKNNTADILNRVAYEQVEILIKRHGKTVAKITPTETKNYQEVVDATYGMLPDFPTAEEIRAMRVNKDWSDIQTW
ncbi:MAG: type II toxin-antitoxin system prevent-host-death family antitoxin [Pseudomonadales bacterium]|nr:type II toxin-antitoxin system prevent-host-death family antitoxin [Candidatus Woesebacteria bacterium]MCB9801815.1 type II toxin-antitoxin system prevent-host-death family antitoxin [Pseudomonadales bacterium]